MENYYSKELLQALTSVKSENAEDKTNPYAKTPEEIAQWVIDNRYPKSEQEKVSDSVMYHTIIKDLHDFANNSEAMKEGEIRFGNHLKALFRIVGNKIEILDAVNGWGNKVPKEEIKVEYLTNKEK